MNLTSPGQAAEGATHCSRWRPTLGCKLAGSVCRTQTLVSFTRSTPTPNAAPTPPLFGASHLGKFLGYPTPQAI
ncbi:hypothetical protein R69619_04794 [Paraburkholderia nemoris]|nr:hypothetical protein R69619_04794 [Paraburkholderia nemoris]